MDIHRGLGGIKKNKFGHFPGGKLGYIADYPALYPNTPLKNIGKSPIQFQIVTGMCNLGLWH